MCNKIITLFSFLPLFIIIKYVAVRNFTKCQVSQNGNCISMSSKDYTVRPNYYQHDIIL